MSGAGDPPRELAQACALPPGYYTGVEMLERDLTRVFARSWQLVARCDQLAGAGDHVVTVVGRTPVLVVRDGGGTLRAMANVCLHRAGPLAHCDGRAAKALHCKYHGWTYDLQGRLRHAPEMAGAREFHVEDFRLPQYRAAVWQGLVFVALDEGTPPLESVYDGIAKRIAPIDLATMDFVHRDAYEIACNWKVYVDNYLDGGYHIPHMHPTLDAQLDMKSYRTEVFEQYSVQRSDAAAGDDERLELSPQARIGGGALYAWLFPNFMVNRYGPCMDSNLVHPLGVDRCRVVYEFFFDDSLAGARDFIEESIAQADVTQREDIEICESVQVGLRSPAYDRGRYAPRVEVGEFHFHQLLAARFAAGRPGDSAP